MRRTPPRPFRRTRRQSAQLLLAAGCLASLGAILFAFAPGSDAPLAVELAADAGAGRPDDASHPAIGDAPVQHHALALPKRTAEAPPPRGASRVVLPSRRVQRVQRPHAAAPPRCTDGVDVPPCRPQQRWCLAHATSTTFA